MSDMEERVDQLEKLVEALRRKLNSKSETIEEHEREIGALRNRVAELENLVEPDPGKGEYDQLSKDRKVWRIRKKLAETAAEGRGAASMDYKDIMWLFDGHPSSGHCYNLMERAGEVDGYEYDKAPDGQRRITVELEGVNDERLLHSVKEGYEPEAA